jgi:signal transduction histidine kinase
MPDNEGFDLCLVLKSDERYKDIPVLIITSLDRLEHKVTVFKMGASDYILKPLNPLETIARVEAQLRIKRFQDRQKELNAELRRTHTALLQSSKMSAVGTLAAGVAHEFNNILQIIAANAELCSITRTEEDLANFFRIIKECTDRGGKIARGLLDFSRKEEYQSKETVRLTTLVAQTMKLMEKNFRDNKVNVSVQLDDVPDFEGYPGQLVQVIVNLVNNAIEAMRDRPTRELTVRLRRCGCDTAYCQADTLHAAERREGCTQLICQDSGCGVPGNLKDKIFEPFMTTKGIIGGGNVATPGTGLGLSVSYGIVRRHGGFIQVDSEEGKGATFTVSLPIAPDEHAR